ncbi:hypothetical protein ATCC90586_010315 [Pythium insidiosum]|nr:hypothetical protein ATCC90586_010315 [Pythium insidiosum]
MRWAVGLAASLTLVTFVSCCAAAAHPSLRHEQPLTQQHADVAEHLRRLVAYTTPFESMELSSAECDAATESNPLVDYLQAIPTTAGLRNCLAMNFAELLGALTPQCSLNSIMTLFSSSDPAMDVLAEFFGLFLAGLGTDALPPGALAALLSSWQLDATKNALFCGVLETQLAPCLETLVPALFRLVDQHKAPCCEELSELLQFARMLAVPGKSLQHSMFDVFNGVHAAVCTRSAKGLCGQPLFGFLARVVQQSQATSVLSPLVFRAGLSLFALPDGDAACDGLERGRVPSRVRADGSAFEFYAASCCATGLSTLLQSVDAIVTQLSGDTLAETLSLMAGLSDAGRSFQSPYEAIRQCATKWQCVWAPEWLSTAGLSPPTEYDPAPKTAKPHGVRCQERQWCDRDNVCSTVCQPGSVQVAPWVARATAFQRNLSYAQSLCMTQLAGSHNSATTLARGHGNRDQLVNKLLDPADANLFVRTNNQFLSLTDQLDIGARFLELDAKYFARSFRSGHCSRIDIPFLDDFSSNLAATVEDLVSSAGQRVAVEWQSSLIGCLPSLGGLRAADHRLHRDSLQEIADWTARHPHDLVVLYTEIGDEIADFGKLDELLEMYEDVFGDVLFTPSDLARVGGDWNSFTLHDLIANGKRVVLGATPSGNRLMFKLSGNRLMFKLSSLCDGWADIPRGSPSQSATSFWGQRMRTGKIVRAYRSALHYTVFSENELGGDVLHGTEQEPDEVNATTLAKFVRAGVNILAPDGLDGATIAAMVWSWASNEPTPSAIAAVISASDGRWYGVRNATGVAHVACVSRADNAVVWRVIGHGQSCPTTFAPGSPRSGLENELLRQTLASSVGGRAFALLDLNLANFPRISVRDTTLFLFSRMSGQ